MLRRARSLTTDELLEAIRLWVAAKYPSYTPLRVTLDLDRSGHQERVKLPIPGQAEHPSADDEETGDYTDLQSAILEALAGVALKSRDLDRAVKANGRLYKKGGLPELQRRGEVLSHPKVGYYRPDAPPENLPPDATTSKPA